jgi:hypothetical protein
VDRSHGHGQGIESGDRGADGVQPPVVFITTREAAERLSTNEHALRERIRRAARRVSGRLVADLGIIQFHKFGRSWRGRWAV